MSLRIISLVFLLFAMPAMAQEPDPLQTDVLDDFAVLEGKWVLQPDSLSEAGLEYRKNEGLTETYVTFTFGTDRQWMEFGDWQLRGADLRHTGAGLVAFSPRDQLVRFTEHGARGASVDGSLVRIDETTFERRITVARTDRSWHQVDRWTFDDDRACFTWQSSYRRNAETMADAPVRYCKVA